MNHLVKRFTFAGDGVFIGNAEADCRDHFGRFSQPGAQFFIGEEYVADPERAQAKFFGRQEHVLDGRADGLDIDQVGEALVDGLRQQGGHPVGVENKYGDWRLLHRHERMGSRTGVYAFGFPAG